MIDKTQAAQLIGRELRTSGGDKVGKIGQIYVDEFHDAPEWVTVNTGLFGASESFVPLGPIGRRDAVVPLDHGAPLTRREDGRPRGIALQDVSRRVPVQEA